MQSCRLRVRWPEQYRHRYFYFVSSTATLKQQTQLSAFCVAMHHTARAMRHDGVCVSHSRESDLIKMEKFTCTKRIVRQEQKWSISTKSRAHGQTRGHARPGAVRVLRRCSSEKFGRSDRGLPVQQVQGGGGQSPTANLVRRGQGRCGQGAPKADQLRQLI